MILSVYRISLFKGGFRRPKSLSVPFEPAPSLTRFKVHILEDRLFWRAVGTRSVPTARQKSLSFLKCGMAKQHKLVDSFCDAKCHHLYTRAGRAKQHKLVENDICHHQLTPNVTRDCLSSFVTITLSTISTVGVY